MKRLVIFIMLAGIVGLAGCDRERRDFKLTNGEQLTASTRLTTLQPGAQSPQPRIESPLRGNAYALSEGKRLYSAYNCVGCHAHGGGGMGPALMDDKWRYGGRIDQIAATIAEGRPNGMPSWRGKLTDDQIWKLAAYVRSLSGQPSKDVVSSRADAMSTGSPQTLTPHQAAKSADTAQQ